MIEAAKTAPREWVKPEVVDIDGGPEEIETFGGNPVPDFSHARFQLIARIKRLDSPQQMAWAVDIAGMFRNELALSR